MMSRLARSKPLFAWRRMALQTRLLASEAEPKGIPYSKLTVGIPKETFTLEKRVAATPESIQRLIQPGFHVLVEANAGEAAHFSNADYQEVGAKIVSTDELWKDSDIVLKVRNDMCDIYVHDVHSNNFSLLLL
jgi:NAD(P) transhydrogenase